MSLSPHLISASLAPLNTPPHIFIAYSGGVDSHVLLHLCASIPALRHKMTAVYVHHGLQPDAESWAKHCDHVAQSLSVEFKLLRVNAFAASGESPEEAARNARYNALKSLMVNDDVLLVAQHRDDQLETVLLQLFRGGGLRGLSGMPHRIAFGPGVLLRPLLDVAKQAIETYAQEHGLVWVEDPSNQCSDYDRNFLRNDILPLLKQRWPALDKTVARSAGHCADAQRLVAGLANDLLTTVFNPADNTLDISRLMTYPSLQQNLVIRQWFEHLGLKMPPQHVLERIQSDVLAAREDACPVLTMQGFNVRRYRNQLYCLPSSEAQNPLDCCWDKCETTLRIARDKALVYMPSSTGILRAAWDGARIDVRFRSGGEKIRLPGRNGRHTLKKLFQEAGIPPWERELMPLIYLDGRLAAVGDRWISAEFYHEQTDACILLVMQRGLR